MERRQSPDLLRRYLNVVMGLAYTGGGIFLIASSQSFGLLPTGTIRLILAVLLIAYGLFRAFRGLQRTNL